MQKGNYQPATKINTMDPVALERKLDRINAKITKAFLTPPPPPKETLVKASVIMQLTGWDREKLRRSRINGYVKQIKENGIWYVLESLNPVFIKNDKAA